MIDQQRFFDALHATWPPAQTAEVDGWRVRRGVNGGKRVSAASGSGDVATAEAAMRALGQDPLFRLTSDDESLDAKLEARGYDVVDPTLVYAARVNMLTDISSGERSADSRVESSSGRTQAHEAMWEKGGIGPGRWAVMDRVVVPKRFLLPEWTSDRREPRSSEPTMRSPWSTLSKCCPPSVAWPWHGY